MRLLLVGMSVGLAWTGIDRIVYMHSVGVLGMGFLEGKGSKALYGLGVWRLRIQIVLSRISNFKCYSKCCANGSVG